MAVLSFAVSIKSDIRATWQLLAQLYAESGSTAKIQEMKLSAASLNSLTKDPILAMLDTYL